MAAPKLLFAGPNGQSSVRVIFDQDMRELGASTPEDPVNPANWSVGGGLPAISSVNRLSNVEFELILASSAPVAVGYSVTVAATVESGSGETMDLGSVTATFDITAADADLVISSVVWTSPSELTLTFSEPLVTILFDSYSDVALFLAQDQNSREPTVIGFSQSGAVITVTLSSAGTAGANYILQLNREVIVADATNTILLSGLEEIPLYGQGAAPTLAALAVSEDFVQATSSEVLGTRNLYEGWGLSHGLYALDIGSLGPNTPLELGSTNAILEAPGANLAGETGNTATFSIRKTARTVTAGSSFLGVASSVVGDGSETVGVGSTTLSKTAGDPYEIVFSGGSDSLGRAGRQFETTLSASFTPGATEFSLLALTLLNTQVSVVLEKTVNDLAVLKLYRGSTDLGLESVEFDPTVDFTLTVVDGAGDSDGFLSVAVDGAIVLGAAASELNDDLLIKKNVGVTAVALTLGHPASPAEVFDLVFSADIVLQSYNGTGFLGLESRDLFSFSGSSISATVAAAIDPPDNPGYQNTGKGAFGAYAEYLSDHNFNAIQVIVGLNADAPPSQFTGTITLTTTTGEVLDQIVIDQNYVLVGENEIFAVFFNPICWSGILVDVTLTIDAVDYSTTVPVTEAGTTSVTGTLAQQPAKWYHQPVSNYIDAANVAAFGPAVIIKTP